MDETIISIAEEEYVDLGLSVNWATCNLPSKVVGNLGREYDCWGMIRRLSLKERDEIRIPKDELTSYKAKEGYRISETKYDPAQSIWGGKWRLPTYKEMKELVDLCEWEVFKVGEQFGLRATGPSGKSIFLPAEIEVDAGVAVVFSADYWSGDWIVVGTDLMGAQSISFTGTTNSLSSYIPPMYELSVTDGGESLEHYVWSVCSKN